MLKPAFFYPVLSLCLGLGVSAHSALAPAQSGVVGAGTVVTCTEGALDVALAGGGTITFNCGPTPATLAVTTVKSITQDTTLDGNDLITLSGQNATRLFSVSNGATLTLRHIELTNGSSAFRGGAIANGVTPADAHGAVVLDHATLRLNTATLGGGAIVTAGPITITNSFLNENLVTDTTPGSGYGGAILAVGGAQVLITDTVIAANTAERGGGIYLEPAAVVTLSGGQLYVNVARTGGGGLLNEGGTATLSQTVVRGNDALVFGGGLANFGGVTTLNEVTVLGNTSGDGAGAYSGTGAVAGDTSVLTLTNVTFSGNLASGNGGGVYGNSGSIAAQYVTLAGNRSGAGSAGLYQNTGAFSVRATLVGGNLSVGNCQGTFVNAGFNFATDTTCAGFNQVTDLQLTPFGYGAFGLAYLPQPDSPALNAVTTGCPPPTRDQRGEARPQGAGCEAGAVEAAAGPSPLHIYLPSILRR